MKLAGMIFDMDGTLANTLPVCYAAFRQAFKEFTGRVYTDEEILNMFGPSEEGIFQKHVPGRWRECLDIFLKAYDQAHREYPDPFPGIIEALNLLKDRKVSLAIVTGKGRHSAEISLKYLGFADYFDVIETGSAAGIIKPRAIRRVLSSWEISPEQAAYLGDMRLDMVSARAAGVMPLAAAWEENADVDGLTGEHPEAFFDSVESFKEWILKNVNCNGSSAGF